MDKKSIGCLLIAILLSGCASIIKGTSQTVTFTSVPDGAEVLVDGMSRGVTPLTLKLKKNEYESVMIKKSGYRPIVGNLEKSYDAVALLNISWDSSTTDMVSGAAYEYEPNSYHFTLVKEVAAK